LAYLRTSGLGVFEREDAQSYSGAFSAGDLAHLTTVKLTSGDVFGEINQSPGRGVNAKDTQVVCKYIRISLWNSIRDTYDQLRAESGVR
jgi:hypothetical protein